jgi:flagellar biosynthesis GTPase FlhF
MIDHWLEESMLKNRMEFTWLRPLFWGLVLVAFVGPTAFAGEPEVIYDKATDRLSVGADMVSLEGLLARIALLSGVEFLMDPEVEQPVSITLKAMSLEKGLKKIMQTLNLRYAMIYQKKEGQDQPAEPLLISMKIVPEGKENNPNLNLAPVVDVNGEAVIRSLSRRSRREGQTPPPIFGYAEKRWQARLNRMPEEKRNRIEEDMKQRQEKRAARMEEVEKRRAERKKKVAKHRARRQAAEEKLRASNPELYELRKQQREEIRQQVMEDLTQ